MKCLHCHGVDMVYTDYKGLKIYQCPNCFAVWITKDKLREFKDKTDEFLCWLKIDLWEHTEQHGVTKSEKRCPVCGKYMHEVDYKGSKVVLPVCAPCKGVWLNYGSRIALFDYLDQVITNETIVDYLKEIGHEAVELVTGRESFKNEMRDLKTILVLIEYRIFSKFPSLEKVISGLPK